MLEVCIRTGSVTLVAQELAKYRFDLMGVQEVRLHGNGRVRLAHPITKIRLPPGTLHASGAKPGSRCEARAYKHGFIQQFFVILI